MRKVITACVALFLAASSVCLSDQKQPSVLFVGGVHSRYVARPLHEMGIELDSCAQDKLPERLATGKYNVVVVGTVSDQGREALNDFMSKGGGVFVCSPDSSHSRTAEWTHTNEWLAALGARPRWEVLQDSDADNVVRDVMGCAFSFSCNVSPPVNEGVRGVLTLMWHGTTGCEPPMSFDLGPDWKVAVRGADSMKAMPSKRHDDILQPWIRKEEGPAGPPLLAVRQVGKGRMAVMAIRYYWLFTPPANCPTTEAMLTAGAGGKPSDWLRVFANCFLWLAEPSMQAGMGGASTPDDLLNPPVQVWKPCPPEDWTELEPLEDAADQGQVAGLIGARTELSSGSGTVADYVKAARAAGLKFIVFLEDSLHMTQKDWDKLVQQCEAGSDESFAAVPGLTYEDAQGNHLYAFADNVKFPKPDMLLDDGRLATTRSSRTRALFDYVNELMRQKIISGYWRHNENYLHFADYKLYNSFPIFSFLNGKQIDDAFDEYRYWMGFGGCQAALAFEIMTGPEQVARRAKEGWRVVCYRRVADLRGKWHEGAWSFHGMMSQYITNGPSILLWQGPNRLVGTHGRWWRPDLFEFRIRLRAASDEGLKSVTIYDGDRGVLRRWLPGGAKSFQAELVLSNCQQLGLFPVVEDVKGRKAIGMESWNRNLLLEEFMCSDRCNFLGSARLRTRDGRQVWTPAGFKGNMGNTPSKGVMDMSVQPAVTLTLNSPTLPIDGRPMGFPTVNLRFEPQIPGELRYPFSYPTTYLIGPEIAIGQGNYVLGYDPAEQGAKTTPLGQPYEQPQQGCGNAWGSWHRLVPMRKVTGWSRTYACNWIPETFRVGWHESRLTMKDTVTVEKEKGIRVMYAGGEKWALHRDGRVIASPEMGSSEGAFSRGTFGTLEHGGGSVMLIALGDNLRYAYNKGRVSLHYVTGKPRLAAGETVHYEVAFAGAAAGTTTSEMLNFARQFGVAKPATAGYSPRLVSGKQLDNYLIWRLDGQGVGIEARIARADMPGFLPVIVEGLNDNWSVQLLDRARKRPNHRALPIRGGRAFAQLDLNQADLDVFIGHPVTCDNPDVKLLVSWQEPGVWFLEAHNATDKAIKTRLTSSRGWRLFHLDETVNLRPGSSRIWHVKEEKAGG